MRTYIDERLRVPRGAGKRIATILTAIVVIILLAGSIGTVGAGDRGVLLRFGAVTGTIFNEGLYVKIPLVHQVVKMST